MKLVVNNTKSKTIDHEFDLYIYHKVWSKILPHDYAEDIEELRKVKRAEVMDSKRKKNGFE